MNHSEHVKMFYIRRLNVHWDDLKILSTKPKYGGIPCSKSRLDLQFDMIKEMEDKIRNLT